jgi:hypothetical protein
MYDANLEPHHDGEPLVGSDKLVHTEAVANLVQLFDVLNVYEIAGREKRLDIKDKLVVG